MTRVWLVALTLLFAACTRVEIAPPMGNAQITALSIGSFYNVVHSGSGTATLYRRADGSRFVRLENFSVEAGPDLFVYTSGVVMPTSSSERLRRAGRRKARRAEQRRDLVQGF
jgi:hypothetical protein